jgi:uncharacterized protein YndB with AHSA1/START domain
MSKKKPKSPVKKSAKKPAPAKKVVKKPAKSKPAPQKAKTAAKKAAPAKKAAKPVATKKPAPKPIKNAAPPKKGAAPKAMPAAAVKPVKKEDVKAKAAPAKNAPVKDVKPATPAENAPKGKKTAVEAPLPPPPPPANLPKLPKGFVLKKQKGKLAPGEKRVFKTNVITHHVISEVAVDDLEKKGKPEPKGKFVMEYIIHTPVTLLYDFLTTPNGLAEWFADGVDMKNDIYTFDWDGQKQNAKIISAKIDNYIRLRWLDKPEGSYFEFRLSQDELTNEVSLMVTDFGESEDDIITSRRLWNSQIQRLVKALGTY